MIVDSRPLRRNRVSSSRPTLGIALLLSLLNASVSTLLAQGSLTPPNPPAPTMKTLDQVEARTPISLAPFTISEPGSYYLTANLTVNTGDAITITTNGVTLDLNGFTIRSISPSPNGLGIRLNSGLSDLTIANGYIRGGVTNNGSGTFNGPGFIYGIQYSGSAPANMLVYKVSVSGCLLHGIQIGYGPSTIVESCTVQTVGGAGIWASLITHCSAKDCGSGAIFGLQVSDCRGESTGSNAGISAKTTRNCYGSNTGAGNGIYTTVAIGCRGVSHSGTGLHAYIANSCVASSTTGTAEDINYKYNMP